MTQKQNITRLTNNIKQIKSAEVGFEAITQIIILCGLACFSYFTYKAPSNQSYSYFFSVAHLVLKGNAPLFVASIMGSFLGPCVFYVNQTNQLKHDSLNMSRKLCLFLRNVLFLVARVGSITMALFILRCRMICLIRTSIILPSF